MFGMYSCTIDRKGNLHIPPQITHGKQWEHVYCWRSADNCRVICFRADEPLQDKHLAGDNLTSQKVTHLPVVGNKIKLPKVLLQDIGEQAVVLCGMYLWVELWPESLWKDISEEMISNSTLQETLAMLDQEGGF